MGTKGLAPFYTVKQLQKVTFDICLCVKIPKSFASEVFECTSMMKKYSSHLCT